MERRLQEGLAELIVGRGGSVSGSSFARRSRSALERRYFVFAFIRYFNWRTYATAAVLIALFGFQYLVLNR
jgi:hypothetical protein